MNEIRIVIKDRHIAAIYTNLEIELEGIQIVDLDSFEVGEPYIDFQVGESKTSIDFKNPLEFEQN